jgi:diaminopimelate decarboxylase
MTGLGDLIVEASESYRDRAAVRDASGSWTYHELARYSAAVAAWLAAIGVAPGDRVLFRAKSSRKVAALTYGCALAGVTAVPVSPAARPFQLAHITSDAEPRVAIGRPVGEPGPAWRDPDQLWNEVEGLARSADCRVPATTTGAALLLYTSGSTGMPKAVVCSHAAVVFATRAVQDRLGYRTGDVIFCRIPLSFDYGLYQLFLCTLAGAELVLAEQESTTSVLHEINRSGATVVPLVPTLATMLVRLASRNQTTSAVRLFTNTGEHLPAGTAAELRRYFPGARLQLMFGTTECKRISILELDGDLVRPQSVGRPLAGTVVEVLDADGRPVGPGVIGEITVRGPHVMSGYWRSPAETAQTFRRGAGGETTLFTGDYGYLDSTGYLFFVGRRDNLFKRRGTRTSAIEIETAAREVAGVTDAVVLPPTPERDAILYVAGTASQTEILDGLRTRLEPAKVLSDCRCVDSLPLTPNGKIDRLRVADLADRTKPGRAVAEAVQTYGTPLFVYDLNRVDEALAALRSAVPAPSAIYYSVKANPHPAIVQAMRTGGCRAEISSVGELSAAIEAGYPGTDCLYTGPGKTPREIALALACGVRRFSIESAVDLMRLAEAADSYGATVECLVRVNVTQPAGTSSLRMTGTASQFGVDEEQLRADLGRFVAQPAVRVLGAHFFPVSNVRDEDGLIHAMVGSIKVAARLRESGLPMSVVDLGGGFAAPYAQPGDLPRYPNLSEALAPVMDACLPGWRAGEVEINFESGRYLAGTCGRLLCTVTDVKDSRSRRFVVLDAGINHLGGLSGLRRTLPVTVTPAAGDGTPAPASLVGPLCTPADVLAHTAEAGELRPGDVVEIPNAGAYGLTASLVAFLSRPSAAEVTVRDGMIIGADRIELQRSPLDASQET